MLITYANYSVKTINIKRLLFYKHNLIMSAHIDLDEKKVMVII